MWRKNMLLDNLDSDQSISEEEETLEGDCSENCVSLAAPRDNKGEIQLLSQFEVLRDSYQFHPTEKVSTSSYERQIGACIDDEVEDPVFNDEDDPVHHPAISTCYSNKGTVYLPMVASTPNSDEDIVSDDEAVNFHTLGSRKKDVGGFWSEGSREAEALVRIHGNSSCSSSGGVFVKENESSKGGGRDKSKPKFSFGFQLQKQDLPLVDSHKSENVIYLENIPAPEQLDNAAKSDVNKFTSDTQLVFHRRRNEQTEILEVPSELPLSYAFEEHSMAEFLDCFKKRSGQLQECCKMVDGSMDEDDLPEASESRLSSDNEENPRSVKSITPSKTMVDQFSEAFGTLPVNDERTLSLLPRPLGGGFSGRLQQVIQSEKERDSEYLKVLSREDRSKDDSDYITVRILSRSLEAKLTVCSCTSIGDGEGSYCETNLQTKMKSCRRTWTIIFNSRICGDVDLEVGNLVCIYSPWKKVLVKEKGEVILCTYFSQMEL